MEKHVNKFVVVWAIGLTAFLLMGLTIPNTFAPATNISSAQMNANFAAIDAAVDALEAAALPTSRGTVLGYIYVNGGTGTGEQGFMKTGGTPTSTRTAAGQYRVTWPGENVLFDEAPVFVQCLTSQRVASTSSIGGGAQTTITTRDLSGTITDSNFWIMLLQDHNP